MTNKSQLKLHVFVFVVYVLWFLSLSFLSFSLVRAQNVDFEIIPSSEVSNEKVMKDVKELADSPGSVRDKYKEKASDDKRGLWEKLASWIMTRDTLLDYVVYLIKFLSQLWLVVWAVMFIYAWYMYATDIMWWDASKWKDAMKYAIIGVVVLSFSYAIMKILTNMFIK